MPFTTCASIERMQGQPTIRGIFLKSHIRAVERAKGKQGLDQLEACFGKSIAFKNSDNVPIRDEVALLECALRIMGDESIPPDRIAYEAGRLHFENFATTPLGKITLPFFKHNYKMIMLNARYLGVHVFHGVKFASEELGPSAVYLVMSNADYPIEHFQGLLQAWMEYCELKGSVTAKKIEEHVHAYTIEWQ